MELDERAKFYLKHKAQIEIWYKLKKHISTCSDQFFCSLEEGFKSLAQQQYINEEALIDVEHGRLGLCKKSWLDENKSRHRVAIALGWNKSSGSFEDGYSGIWVDKDVAAAPKLAQKIKDIFDGVRGERGFSTSGWWPAWKYEKPTDPDYWSNLDVFGQELIERIEERWKEFSPIVDQAIAAVGENE